MIGMLLLFTAIAKLWMLLTDSFADVRVSLPKEILWVSVVAELVLAWVNFRFRDPQFLSVVNTTVFASFAIFAIVRLAMGYASCGCSGKLELPAWLFITLDIGIVSWFLLPRYNRKETIEGAGRLVNWWRELTVSARGRFAGLGFFVVVIGFLQFPFAGPLRAKIFGEQPIQASVYLDENLILGEQKKGRVVIWNQTNHAAKIIGVARSCRCFDLVENPVGESILPHDRVPFAITIKPNNLGSLRQRVELFLDHPEQFRMNIDVVGFVKGER